MKVQEKALEEIRPYENNPRKSEPAVEKVAESLKEFGWQQPIVVDADGVIIAGHTRWHAARRLGMQTAPVVVADNLTEDQVRAYRLADNKTNEFASWDIDLLDSELLSIDDIDMELFGFDMTAVADRAAEVQEDDYDVQVPKTPTTKPGDIYELGEHRLICGDATKEDDLLKIVNRGGCRFTINGPTIQRRLHGQNQRITENRKRQNEQRRIPAFFSCGF